MKKINFLLFVIAIFFNCKSDKTVFPSLKDITELSKTEFVPTFKSSFVDNKNYIYSTTILYAWDEIKTALSPLSTIQSLELQSINSVKSYENTLNESEYKTNIEITENKIKARAYFRKPLPFENEFTKFKVPLQFNKSKVESFGFFGNSKDVKINYYKNKYHFSISLFPEDSEYEIILMLYNKKQKSFNDFYSIYNKLKQQNTIELTKEDKVEIPIISFNIKKSYDEVVGTTFYSNNTEFSIVEFTQENAFVLNEKGAEVESKSSIIAVKEAIEQELKPKALIFNKPFVVFLKRKDAKFPYFSVYIQNSELLSRVEE